VSHTTKTNQILHFATPRWRSPPQSSWVLRGDVGWAIAWCITTPASWISVGRALPLGKGLDTLAMSCMLLVRILPNSSSNHRNHMKSPSFKQSINTATFPQPDLDVCRSHQILDPWILALQQCFNWTRCRDNSNGTGVEDGAVFRCWLETPKAKGYRLPFNLTISLWWTMFIHTIYDRSFSLKIWWRQAKSTVCLLHPPIITSGERWLQKRTKVWHETEIPVGTGGGMEGLDGFL